MGSWPSYSIWRPFSVRLISNEFSNGMATRYDVSDLRPMIREAHELLSRTGLSLGGFDMD